MTDRIVLSETSYRGVGAVQGIANEAKARGFRKAFICSDPNLIKFNTTCRVAKVLEDAGLAYKIYSNIKPNSTIENVQTGVAASRASRTDYIIAIGGNSSMDASKAISVIITNPEFEGVGSLEGAAPTRNPCVPIIAVPTAAGTVAEVTINYVVTDAEKRHKFVYMDTHDIPTVTVVDPEMMSSMPKELAAATGMDALTRAIEGYTAKGIWEMTDMFNLKVIEVVARSLRDVVEDRPEGREGMVLSQYLTGMGFSNRSLGIVHSIAHGLGALYDTPHGVVDAIILPTVMEYNTPCTRTKFKDTAIAAGMDGIGSMTQEEYRGTVVDAVKKLSADVGIPADLREALEPEDMDFLSQSAMDDVYRPGNPEGPSFKDIKNLYLSLM